MKPDTERDLDALLLNAKSQFFQIWEHPQINILKNKVISASGLLSGLRVGQSSQSNAFPLDCTYHLSKMLRYFKNISLAKTFLKMVFLIVTTKIHNSLQGTSPRVHHLLVINPSLLVIQDYFIGSWHALIHVFQKKH